MSRLLIIISSSISITMISIIIIIMCVSNDSTFSLLTMWVFVALYTRLVFMVRSASLSSGDKKKIALFFKACMSHYCVPVSQYQRYSVFIWNKTLDWWYVLCFRMAGVFDIDLENEDISDTEVCI